MNAHQFVAEQALSSDLINTIVLLSVFTIGALIYLLRVLFLGRAQYERTDKEKGSALLNKGFMEMGYWMMQPVGRLFVVLHISPNVISWMSLFWAIVAGACLAYGHFGFGAAFATISALMDLLDGMVARLTSCASDAGEVLDASIDRYVEFFFLAGLAVFYRENAVLLVLTLLALMGCFMVSYSTAKAEALKVEVPRGNMRRTERAVYLILGAALSPITIPWERLKLEESFGIPMVIALGIVSVLANVSAIERLTALAQKIRINEKKNKIHNHEKEQSNVHGEECKAFKTK